jgi:calcium binding protein 39
VATFLQTNFDMFFSKYNTMLISSESYVTKRQSIKLLGEILLDRANYNVMTQYVDSGEHLKIIMKLLRDDRRMINYEGFHVFKVGPRDTLSPSSDIDVCRFLLLIPTNPSPCSASSLATYCDSYPTSSKTAPRTSSSSTRRAS